MMIEAASPIMTVDECAKYLRVNRKTIYDAVKRGELPGAQSIRGTIRIHRETVLAWFATGEAPAKQRKRTR